MLPYKLMCDKIKTYATIVTDNESTVASCKPPRKPKTFADRHERQRDTDAHSALYLTEGNSSTIPPLTSK
jgi:hypothetical protein